MACDIEVDPILVLRLSVPRPAVRLPALRVPLQMSALAGAETILPPEGVGDVPVDSPALGLDKSKA